MHTGDWFCTPPPLTAKPYRCRDRTVFELSMGGGDTTFKAARGIYLQNALIIQSTRALGQALQPITGDMVIVRALCTR